MNTRRRYRPTASYAFALLSVGILAWFELATWPLFRVTPFLPLAAGVVIAAALAGPGPGLFATVLGTLATTLLPRPAPPVSGPEAFAPLVAFIGIGVAVSVLSWERHSSRARIRRILGGVSDGCAFFGPDWKCVYVNGPAASQAGRTPEELVGSGIAGVFPHAAEPPVIGGVRLAMDEGIPGRYETFDPDRDRWFETNLYPTAEGVTVMVRDVTARRQAEESLRDSERRLRAIFDQAIAGIAQTDPEGRFLMVNERYCEIVGRSASELAALRLSDITHPEDLPRNSALFEGLLGDGGNFVVEERYVRPDGTQVWVRKQVSAVRDADGTPRSGFAIVEEITERKRAEAEKDDALRREQGARAEAEAANRSKDEFLAVVSHELRTPLTAILGWLRLMKLGAVETSSRSRALDTVERNANALVRLVEDLLDVSRIVAGKLELETSPMKLSAVAHAATEAVRPAAEAKQISISSRLDPDPSPVLGDPARLQQAVWNLLANAVKFTPQGGRIDVSLERQNGTVQLTVADSGIGIRREFLPRVFERFRQADSTQSRKHSGLGLGLSIVRHVVEMHGGSVRAESPGEGRGATFTLTLPVHRAPTAALAPVPPLAPILLPHPRPGAVRSLPADSSTPLPSLKGACVLLVEDEADSRALLTRVLTWRGAEVHAASSALEARALLRRRKPDVLVSDIGMPGESGYALIESIRAAEAGSARRLPAVALTAYAQEAHRAKALAAGYDAHVPKPVEPALLIRTVAALLEDSPMTAVKDA